MIKPLFPNTTEPVPQWHYGPLHLSTAQMQNPYEVLEGFFDCYSLPEIRFCLRQWLDASMCCKEYELRDFLLLRDQLLTLIEAAWVVMEKTKNQAPKTNT